MDEPISTPAPGFDFTRTFRFFFEDPDWLVKLVLGAAFTLLSLFLVGSFWVAGYLVRLVRRVAAGASTPLPDWDDLGGIFQDGLRGVVVLVAHLIPLLAVQILLLLAMTGGRLIAEGPRDIPQPTQVALLLSLLVGYVLFSLILLAGVVYVPAAFLRFALLDRLGAAFEVRANVDFIRRNLGSYLLAILSFLVASFVAQLGFFVFCIGFFPALFWALAVLGYSLGQVARGDEHLVEAAALSR